MSESSPKTSPVASPIATPRKKPVDVQSRIQRYQKPTEERSKNQLVKSNSYNDLQSLRTKVDVRDSWLQISVIDKHPSSSSSPNSTPPKPPSRKKKFQPMELPKHPYIKTSDTTPTEPKKLGSTELSLLPPSQPKQPPQRAQTLRAHTVKPIPPRPPPPSLKPVKTTETIKPVANTNRKEDGSVSPSLSPNHNKPIPATSPKQERRTNKPAVIEPQKSMSSRPLPSIPSMESPSSIRKNSGNSSSLSDSNEEEKKGNYSGT